MVDSPELYWNSRFPEDGRLLSGEAVAPVGTVLLFETAIEPVADRRGVSTAVRDPKKIMDALVTFELRGNGVSFADAEDGADSFASSIRSPPLLATGKGTVPYRAQCRVDVPGPVSIEAAVVVRNGTLMNQEIPFNGAGAAAPAEAPRVIDGGAVARAPVVVLRLSARTEGGGCEFEASWSTGAEIRATGVSDATGIAAQVAGLRSRLVQLSRSYRPLVDGPDFALENTDEVLIEFANVGSRLHELLFGLPGEAGQGRHDLSELAIAIARTGRDGGPVLMQASAPDMPIPWAVLYDGRAYGAALDGVRSPVSERYSRRPTDRSAVDPLCFWGWRFNISRTVPNAVSYPSETLGSVDGARVQAVYNRTLEPFVDNQRQLFQAAPGQVLLESSPVLEDADAFLKWVHDGADSPCDLLYFFCHAGAPREFSERGFRQPAQWMWDAYLGLSGEEGDASGRVTLDRMREKWRQVRERQPLVFLNACGSAETDAVYGSPFVQHFFASWQVRALLGTDCVVPAAFADVFSRHVLAALRRGDTSISEAIREASMAAFAQGNPFPLLYSLYGRNDLRLPKVSARG